MAVEIGTLRALLSLDSAAFDKGAKRAQASMGNLERSLAKTGQRLQSIGKTITTRLTLPLVAATGLLVRSSLSAIDAQAKMAQSLGTTTASLQVLARAAETAGISQEELDGSLRRMTRRISLAETGAGAGAKALKRLGLAASDFVNIDAAERVKLIQQRLQELIPAAERAGVASEIFGDKSGLALLRLDASSIDAARAELDRFGVTVSELDTDKIEEANDAMSGLGLVTKGLGNTLAVALAPTLTAISQALADVAAWFTRLSPIMKQSIGIAVALAAAIGPVTLALGFMASGMAAAIGGVSGLVAALFTLKGALIATGFGAIIVAVGFLANKLFELVEATGSFGGAMDVLGSVASAVWDGIATSALAIRPALQATWKEIRADFFSMLADIQAAWAMFLRDIASGARLVPFLNETALSLGNAAIMAGSGVHEFAEQAKEAAKEALILRKAQGDLATLGFDKASEALGRLNAITAEVANRPAIKLPPIIGGEDGGPGKSGKTSEKELAIRAQIAQAEREIGSISKINAAIRRGANSEAIKGLRDQLTVEERLAELRFDGFSDAQIARIGTVLKLKQQIVDENENLTTSLEDQEQVTGRVEDAFQSAFSGFVTGTNSAKEALRGLLNSLAQVAASEAFRGITGGGKSGGGGLFSSILGFGLSLLGGGGSLARASASSALQPNAFGGRRADGGPVSTGKTYLVGERGPELFTPRANGQIIPNGAGNRQAGGEVTINLIAPEGFTAQQEGRVQGIAINVVNQRTPGIVGNAFSRAREERSFG